VLGQPLAPHRQQHRQDHRPDEQANEPEGRKAAEHAEQHDDEGDLRAAADQQRPYEVVGPAHHQHPPAQEQRACHGVAGHEQPRADATPQHRHRERNDAAHGRQGGEEDRRADAGRPVAKSGEHALHQGGGPEPVDDRLDRLADGGQVVVDPRPEQLLECARQLPGELLAAASETLTNALSFSGTSTIAAAHGTTLNENASDISIGGNSTLNFGAPGQDGTIVWDATFGSIAAQPLINVEGGALKGANAQFGSFLSGSPITVAAGATLDLGGDSSAFANLTGAGTVTNSGASGTQTLTIGGGTATTFSGAVSDGSTALTALTLQNTGTDLTLSGANTYSGATTINSGSTLALSGTGSIVNSSVSDNATFDISGLTSGGTSIVSLSGTGALTLGSNTLTLSNATGTFSGTSSGSGGLTLTTGTETISSSQGYTGATTINGGTLKLTGSGSLASSSGVADGGTFDISGLSAGTSIASLSGAGALTLGSNTLTLSNASGTFSGTSSGSVTMNLVPLPGSL